ncbi:hypothetical protein [Clostridium perfringens]|uniref:hypothetical protein n=1 Tax=Clostridium perfringens TaxID=1502 RepID=UPI0007768660|nr:hypothetical protein [Clostridium perfringens]AMN31740.1 hypothetical protein JFP55_01970 [Clostridium perfringens]
MIKTNQAVKLIESNGRKEVTINEHIGFIKEIYKDFILIELKNYDTCLNKADLIENIGLRLQVRKENEWIEVGKEIFEGIKVPDGPKDRNIYRPYKKRSKERR